MKCKERELEEKEREREARCKFVVTEDTLIGKDETYYSYYHCPFCEEGSVSMYDKYCSECGNRIVLSKEAKENSYKW